MSSSGLATPPVPTVRTVAMGLAAVMGAVVVGCALSLLTTLLAVRLHDAGFSSRAIGVNTAAAGLATLVGAPFVRTAARLFGVARLLAGSLLLGGATMALFALTDTYSAWLGLRFGEGLCATAVFILAEFWLASAAGGRRRGLVIGVYVTCLAIGFACGPQLLDLIGPAGATPFLVGGALFAAGALPLMLQTPKPPPLVDQTAGRGVLRHIGEMPTVMLAALLHGAIEIAGLTFLPVYALGSGEGIERGALFASLFVIGSGAFQIPIGLLADRFDRRRLLAGLAALGCAGAIVLALIGTRSLLVFALVLVVWGGVVGTLYPVGLGEVGRRYQGADLAGADLAGADLAGANSAYVMMYAAGMLVGPPVVGVGLDLMPPSGLFWALALLTGVYLAMIATTARLDSSSAEPANLDTRVRGHMVRAKRTL